MLEFFISLFVILFIILEVVYVVDVYIYEIYNIATTKLDLILSCIIPFYLWFLMLKARWHELD